MITGERTRRVTRGGLSVDHFENRFEAGSRYSVWSGSRCIARGLFNGNAYREQSFDTRSQRTFNPSIQPLYGLSNPGAGELSFLAIIVLIFLPSAIFSLLVRRWAQKRAREYL